MTDNEIIKTLERCETSNGCCYGCPLEDIAAIQNIQVCQDKLITEAYKLIDRQNAEITRLEKENTDKERAYTEEYSFRKELGREIKKLNAFKEYWDELYGTGLEIAKWHLNGESEPFDNFYDAAMERMEKY